MALKKHLPMSIYREHTTVMRASIHGPHEDDRSNQRIVFLVHARDRSLLVAQKSRHVVMHQQLD